MKILICLLLMVSIAQASWYVVNIDNEVIVKCEYQPDFKDLESRNEIAVFSEDAIEFSEAEYRSGKIVKHIQTASELALEQEQIEKQAENLLINKKMKDIAITALEESGVVLKHNKKEKK